MGLSARIPWWGKIGAKLVLSRLPVSYGAWSRLGVFRHGDMADPSRAIAAFRAHFQAAQAVHLLPRDFTTLELGPGDSLLSAGVARAAGGGMTWLVDAGDFARRDAILFHALDDALPASGLPALGLPRDLGFEAILDRLGARYRTNGLASLGEIPSASVDLVWSSVALEHVYREEFEALAVQLARVLKPDGVMSHAVDLRDHLGGSLNNLRFSDRRWESRSWRRAGFYTNRMSQAEILAAFARAGLRADRLRDDLWPAPPLDRSKMDRAFRDRSDEELRIAGFDVVLVRDHV